MKQRLSLSVEQSTATYLSRRADDETNGNVSAMVDRIVRQAWLAEAVEAEIRWYERHPGVAEEAERERHLAETSG